MSIHPGSDRHQQPAARGLARTALTAALVGGLVIAPAVLAGSAANAAPAAAPTSSAQLAETKAPSKLTVRSSQSGGSVTLSVVVEAVGSSVVPTGTVTVMEGGDWFGDFSIVAGRGSRVLPKLAVGEHTLLLNFTGDANTLGSQAFYTLVVTPEVVKPTKASSRVKASFTKASKHRVKAKVTVTTAAKLTGWIEIRDGSKLVAKRTIKSLAGAGTTSTSVKLTTKRLKKGKRKLTVRYLGSATVKAASRSYTVRVR